MGDKDKRAIIVGGGPLHEGLLRTALAAGYDLLLAVDGGGRPLADLGFQPQLLVGDFDSLPPAYQTFFMDKGVERLAYPPEKDWTDLEIGLNHLSAKGFGEFLVFGALGGRLDHTMANLSLLYSLRRRRGYQLVCFGAEQAVTLLTAEESIKIFPFPGGHFSLLPFPETARGVSIRNAKYPLVRATLELGTTRGVHNEFLTGPAEVCLEDGAALVIVEGLAAWPGGNLVFQRIPRAK
ncbi:MAG TPA: thiamine diphosphokinase [Capillibacterium sp.]